MRLIDADHLLNEIADLKKSPWYNENYNGAKAIRSDAISVIEDLCIEQEPTVCDIDAILDEIQAEKKGYPPSADYYKAISKVYEIIINHTKGEQE